MGYRDLADLAEFYALRWSVVRFPGAAADSLVFETVFHGDWEQYLLKLMRKTATGVDKHAGYIGYPGAEDLDVFLSFLIRRHTPALHVWAANPMMSPVAEHLRPRHVHLRRERSIRSDSSGVGERNDRVHA